MKQALMNFWQDEEGAAMIEYALIAALISVVAITALTDIGGAVQRAFASVRDAFARVPANP